MTTPVEAPASPSPFPSSRAIPRPTSRADAPLILVIDDEPAPLKMIEAGLSARQYRVATATTGAQALEALAGTEPDAMIVDLGLPDIDGLDLCRQLRLRTTSPIIVVTADGSEERMVQALDDGADDYVIKPFSMPELIARIGVALRHQEMIGSTTDERIIVLGSLEVDVRAHEVRVHGQPVHVPARQFKLLTMLVRNPGRILTYHSLVRHLWEPGTDATTQASVSHALRILVSKLRSNLGQGDGVPRIVTEPYIGYRLVPSDAA